VEPDAQRIEWIADELHQERLDALICGAPEHVLMLTGYWPVTGNSLAVVTANREVTILAPADEEVLAKESWADQVITFKAGSLDELYSTTLPVVSTLDELLVRQRLTHGRLGYDASPMMRPASYVAQQVYQNAFCAAARPAQWVDSGQMLSRLRSRLTSREIERVRQSCEAARVGFESVKGRIRTGMTESAVASALQAAVLEHSDLNVHRGLAFAFCMSGPNSYEAFAAFQRSRCRTIQNGDLVLLHCNSCIDGFWTDMTRTFVVGGHDDRQKAFLTAIFEARSAALQKIRPSVVASHVDAAARNVMRSHRFEKQFKHPTGHGVGFAAIDHNAIPRIHPASDDVLEEGMVLNIEPGIYLEGYGGARQCDMVAVTATGYELLTDFFSTAESVILQS
jgi:Xaa-Pro aminopeptidase